MLLRGLLEAKTLATNTLANLRIEQAIPAMPEGVAINIKELPIPSPSASHTDTTPVAPYTDIWALELSPPVAVQEENTPQPNRVPLEIVRKRPIVILERSPFSVYESRGKHTTPNLSHTPMRTLVLAE